jgi:peroxin-7
MTPQGLMVVAAMDAAEGLFDCSWSEENPDFLCSGSGDGSVKIWNIAVSNAAQ